MGDQQQNDNIGSTSSTTLRDSSSSSLSTILSPQDAALDRHEHLFHLLQNLEIDKPFRRGSLSKSRSESVLPEYIKANSWRSVPLSDIGLPRRKAPIRMSLTSPTLNTPSNTSSPATITTTTTAKPSSPFSLRQSTEGRIQFPSTVVCQNDPLSPSRHRKSISWHHPTSASSSSSCTTTLDEQLEQMHWAAQGNNQEAGTGDEMIHAAGASLKDHESLGDSEMSTMSPLQLQKLKLQRKQRLESLARERSNSSHTRIHKRPKNMAIIAEESN